MSDYYWTCPSCGSIFYWGDGSYYCEELDDKICADCYSIDQSEKLDYDKQNQG